VRFEGKNTTDKQLYKDHFESKNRR
jgi:hypothetical protein